jgi:hypothetical protein
MEYTTINPDEVRSAALVSQALEETLSANQARFEADRQEAFLPYLSAAEQLEAAPVQRRQRAAADNVAKTASMAVALAGDKIKPEEITAGTSQWLKAVVAAAEREHAAAAAHADLRSQQIGLLPDDPETQAEIAKGQAEHELAMAYADVTHDLALKYLAEIDGERHIRFRQLR